MAASAFNNKETGSSIRTKYNDWVSEYNTHVTSAVTLTGSQTLTNKDLTSGTNTFPTSLVTLTGAQTLTNKTLTSPAITTPTGIVKGDVGLGNVDNTSDANKPVSTATTTALALKQTANERSTLGLRVETIVAGFTVDNGKSNSIQRITTSGSDINVTFPAPSSLTWPDGAKIIVINEGASGHNVILATSGSGAIRAYNSLNTTVAPGEAAVLYVGSTTEWLRVS